MISPIEKTIIEFLVDLNNSIFNQMNYDKRKYQMELYNRFFMKLPEDVQKALGLAYPVPMKIDYELLENLYKSKDNIKEKQNTFVAWIRRRIWKSR